jgi:hypothetical protein
MIQASMRRTCLYTGFRAPILAVVLSGGHLGCGPQGVTQGQTSGSNGEASGAAGSGAAGSGTAGSGAAGSGSGSAGATGQTAESGSGTASGGSSSGASAGAQSDIPDARSAEASVTADEAGQDAGDASTIVLPKRVLLYYDGASPTITMQSVMNQLTFYTSTLTGWGFASDESVDPTTITDANLEHYALLAMINTCFAPFGQGNPDEPQSMVIQRFLQRGGSLFGTHCADVTFQGQTPVSLYNQLIGGQGGAPPGGTAFFQGNNNCRKLADHPSTTSLPATFSFMGNLDNTDYLASDSTILVKCTWVTTNGADVAVSWYRYEGLGRVFYTDFAKVEGDLTDPVIGVEHIVPALSWTLRR